MVGPPSGQDADAPVDRRARHPGARDARPRARRQESADLPHRSVPRRRPRGTRRAVTSPELFGVPVDFVLFGLTLVGVALLVDARRGLEDEEHQLLELLSGPARVSRRPLELFVVATKLDKLPASQRKLTLAGLIKNSGQRVLGFSAKEQLGRDELWRRVRSAAGLDVG